LEAVAGKPLRIGGVAIAAGMSRNFNVYTPEELQSFASKLVGAPVYIEHVSVANAAGKVTKCEYDSASRCLLYEAEIYDQAIADKIRNGLIQHVSVSADYEAIDMVDAKVPHGLYNPELSLVAVPGIPEANIQILERLRESLASKGHGKLKLSVKELLEPLTCVFCGQPGTFLVSTCEACGDKAAAGQVLNALSRLKISEAAGDLPSDFTAFKVRFQVNSDNPCPRCEALNGKEFIYGTEPEVPLHENCQCSYEMVERLHVHLPAAGPASQASRSGVEKLEEKELKELIKSSVAEALKVREQSDVDKQAQVDRSQKYGIGIKQDGNLTKPGEFASIPDDEFADPVNFKYPIDKDHVQAALGYFNQPDNRVDYSAEEQAKIMAKIVGAALAAGIQVSWQANDPVYKALPVELQAKCQGYVKESTDAEKLVDATSKLAVANKTIESLKKLMPGVDLLANPPVLMPVLETVTILEKLVPPLMAERSSMFSQRQAQAIRAEIFKAKEKLKAK
jgi:hypothetical protein